MPATVRASLLSLCLLVLCGCATLPPGSRRDPRDPWERLNRTSYKVNDVLDRHIVKPVAKAYAKAPQPLRTGLGNFWDNLDYPVTITNDLLQGQIKAFVSDIARFVFNSTFGIAGFIDVASMGNGLPKNSRDFGQTMGKWGVPPGPYVMVPVFGPYTVRDGIGASTVDTLANPRTYTNFWVATGLWAAEGVDHRSRILYLDPMIQSAYDPYGFVRNAYLQNRDFKVHGAGSKSEEEQEQKLLEEAGEDEATPAGSPPAAAPPTAPPAAPQGTQPQPPQNPPQ
ncbi:MAG TPA: VacJ family lipoprotein [Steroidobacteraceae bacterium]|nr:VacJ family lipoprotein [Steroidobacteraceae bacterium]